MNRTSLMAIVYGWIAALIIIFLASSIVVFIIKFTSISEVTLGFITLAIGLTTLFIGGIVAGLKAKEKGWLIGLIIGLGFALLTFTVQYLGVNVTFTIEQVIYHSTYTLAAIIGSIFGVNLSNNQAS